MTTKQLFMFGLHSVENLLEKNPTRAIRLFVLQTRRDKRLEKIIKLAQQVNIPIERVTQKELDNMTQGANHQGVVVICRQISEYSEDDLPEILKKTTDSPLLLILDGVQDPHNLGACFRSADAAGVHAIIAPKDKAVGLTPAVSKVASGAIETVPFVQVTNLARTLERIKELGIWIYGAVGEASNILYETDLSGPTAIVLGAEGKGLRRLTREHCDMLLKIPMQGNVSSLNVSVAAGIFLFEVMRQRKFA